MAWLRFLQLLLLQPQIVPASTVSNEASSAQAKAKKTPCGAAKGAKTTKTPKAPKKAAAIDSDKQSVKKATKTPKRSSNKKTKVGEPAKARKPKSDKPLQCVDTNDRASTKKRGRSELTDTDDSDTTYDDDDDSSD